MKLLFGGAIQAQVPEGFYNASEFRDVPDNQEMFVGEVDGINSGFIVELCEPVHPGESLQQAFVEHVHDLHNSAGIDPDLPVTVETVKDVLKGREYVGAVQTVDDAKKGVTLLSIAIFRIPDYKTDVVITCSIEIGDRQLVASMIASLVNQAKTCVSECCGTFKVLDGGLFNNE